MLAPAGISGPRFRSHGGDRISRCRSLILAGSEPKQDQVAQRQGEYPQSQSDAQAFPSSGVQRADRFGNGHPNRIRPWIRLSARCGLFGGRPFFPSCPEPVRYPAFLIRYPALPIRHRASRFPALRRFFRRGNAKTGRESTDSHSDDAWDWFLEPLLRSEWV